MKAFFILLTLCLSTAYANGQQKDIFKNKPWEDFKKKELLTEKLRQSSSTAKNDNLLQLIPEIAESKSVLKIPLTHTYIGSTGTGSDVYSISPYKMICIAPDKTFMFNMPVAGFDKSLKNNSLLLQKRTEEK